MAKNINTNALRLMKQAGIPCVLHSVDKTDSVYADVCQRGLNPVQVFKTLVTQSSPAAYFVFIIPITEELNLKKAARAAGVKKIDLIPMKSLREVTGYMRGGCSPVGMKKLFPSFLDLKAAEQETILVSAGKIGWQMELSPGQLKDYIGASYEDLT